MFVLLFGSISSMTPLMIPAVIAVLGAAIMMFASFAAHRSMLRVGWDLLMVILLIGASVFVISRFVGQTTTLVLNG